MTHGTVTGQFNLYILHQDKDWVKNADLMWKQSGEGRVPSGIPIKIVSNFLLKTVKNTGIPREILKPFIPVFAVTNTPFETP